MQKDTATNYAQAVASGQILSNAKVFAHCKNHLQMVANPTDDCRWEPERAEKVFDWISENLKIRLHGKLVKADLLDYQRYALAQCIAFIDADGYPVKKTLAVEIARGAGKTLMMVGWLLYRLCDKEEPHSELVVLAQSLQQLSALYVRPAKQIAEDSGLDIQTSSLNATRPWIRCAETGSQVLLIAGRARSAQGHTSTLILYDEASECVEPDIWEALLMGQAKDSRCCFVSICTPPTAANASGVYSQYRRGWIAAVEEADPSVSFIQYGLDAGDDIEDESLWDKAYPAFGKIQTKKAYRRDLEAAKRGGPDMVGDFMLRRLCVENAIGGAYIPGAAWERAELEFDPMDFAGSECYAALDCSKSIDATALSVIWPQPGGAILTATWHFFPTPEGRPQHYKASLAEWETYENVHVAKKPLVDYDQVKARLNWLVNNFDCKSIQVDRYSSKGDTTVAELMANPNYPMEACSQTAESMAGPVSQLRIWLTSLPDQVPVMRVKPDPVQKYALGCVRVDTDWAGNLRINKARSTASVDSIVSLAMSCKAVINAIPQRSAFENPEATI